MSTVTIPQTTQTEQAFVAAVTRYAAKATECLPQAGERVDKAVALVLTGAVEVDGPGRYAVASACSHNDTWYMVNQNACTCPDYQHRHISDPDVVCKHIIATWLYRRALAATQKETPVTIPTDETPETNAPELPDAGLSAADLDDIMTNAVRGWQTEAAPAVEAPALPEAPASVNVRFLYHGREIQLTLRDTQEERLMERLAVILDKYAPGK